LWRRASDGSLAEVGGRELTVDFVGERHVVDAGTAFTFGRAADLVIDEDNLYLHRVVGRFVWHDGLWWIENLGQRIELDVESDTGVRARLPARETAAAPVAAPLVGSRSAVRFAVGVHRYELDAFHGSALLPASGPLGPPGLSAPTGRETSQFGRVELTGDERALLAALAEPALRDLATAGADRLPANRELAARLGWSLTKFNRKLDYLCVRLTKAGVRGLQGGRGAEAVNRRWRLVEHAVSARLVTAEDLPPPR
jgi:hypothetical protein